jgi:hypothetical protein
MPIKVVRQAENVTYLTIPVAVRYNMWARWWDIPKKNLLYRFGQYPTMHLFSRQKPAADQKRVVPWWRADRIHNDCNES